MVVSFEVSSFSPLPYRYLVAYTRDPENFQLSSASEDQVRWAQLTFDEAVLNRMLTEDEGRVRVTLGINEWVIQEGIKGGNLSEIYYAIYVGVILPSGSYVDYHYGDVDEATGQVVPFVLKI